ncbi:hypothetical protein SODALDRAFT_41227 [Sodiomyces alkalinus F11]|uniref:Uncharacterized protein n=1 Tax=Sodiomyces alkalinus (strain CBS 110278 / VKM F-3762 / F11) TaxID=1314773 RepID=A0A3N2QA28_SODAK|nr:hypothetical protein SODALDRAFT_41227 [Sodiomyces alkalinus F11]ROT43518.1 hypothetical protein SODALDRAFT_41227 [Sodiomyces alkalinus F11]
MCIAIHFRHDFIPSLLGSQVATWPLASSSSTCPRQLAGADSLERTDRSPSHAISSGPPSSAIHNAHDKTTPPRPPTFPDNGRIHRHHSSRADPALPSYPPLSLPPPPVRRRNGPPSPPVQIPSSYSGHNLLSRASFPLSLGRHPSIRVRSRRPLPAGTPRLPRRCRDSHARADSVRGYTPLSRAPSAPCHGMPSRSARAGGADEFFRGDVSLSEGHAVYTHGKDPRRTHQRGFSRV